MTLFFLLIVLGGFFLNLPLQMGIGVREIFNERQYPLVSVLFEVFIVCVSVLIQWILFSFVFSPLALGFFKYFLLLPLNVLIPFALNNALKKMFPAVFIEKDHVFLFSHESGAGLAAIIIMLNAAGTLAEAVMLALGISTGILFSIVVLRAIRVRIETEKISPVFRDTPLLLITMGLLSVTFTALAAVYLGF